MKAVVLREFGGPENFEVREERKPAPGPGQVLVRVLAAGVNPVDVKLRSQRARVDIPLPAILGWDVAGVVEALGPGAADFQVGDKVFYTPGVFDGPGAYAEYHVAKQEQVEHKPANLTFIEAAGLPLAGCTAWDALIGTARLSVGETALIHAAAGGVGSLAVQIAKAAGARVIGVTSAGGAKLVRALGADVVVDRGDDFVAAVLRETDGLGADVTFDTVGGETLARSIAATRPHGRLSSIVSAEGNLNPAYLRNQTIHFVYLERSRAKMTALRRLVERGQLRPVIDSVLALEHVAQAHARLERGGMRGKIVLQTSPEAEER